MNQLYPRVRRLVVSVLSLALFVPALAVQAQTLPPQPPRLNVSGQGSASAPIKFATIRLSVVANARTAGDAQNTLAKNADALVKMLQKEKVDRLSTLNISLQPIYHQKKTEDAPTIVEYQASTSIEFSVPVARAGEMLDRSVKLGANRIENVELRPDPADLETARKAALAVAARDARDKGDVVLAALGLKAKEILEINANVDYFQPPMPAQFTRMTTEASTPVVGQGFEVRANVSLSIKY